jgi:hypothetical protein
MKFHGNPSGETRVVAFGKKDGLTDMKKLIIAFCNCFAKVLNNQLWPFSLILKLF